MAEQHVGMAVRRLGVGGDDDVGAEIERALAEGRHRRVVDHQQRRRPHEPRSATAADVADVERRIGRAFRQRPGGSPRSRRRETSDVGLTSQPTPKRACRKRSASSPGRVVAVGWQEDAVAGFQQAEERPPRSLPCPTGTPRMGRLRGAPSISSTASQVGLLKRPYWLKPVASPGAWKIAAMVRGKRDGVARRQARRGADGQARRRGNSMISSWHCGLSSTRRNATLGVAALPRQGRPPAPAAR